MKRIVLILAVAIMSAATAPTELDWRDGFTDYIARENSGVVAAKFVQPRSLWVSMRANGYNRDGFAEYVCAETFSAGRKHGDGVTVTILDAGELSRDSIVEMGKAFCK